MEHKKTYEVGRKKASELLEKLESDIEKGYFNLFEDTEKVIIDVVNQLDIFLNSKTKTTLTFSLPELNTLKANDYLSGRVSDWYYPELNLRK